MDTNTNESKRVFAVGDRVGIKRLDGTIGGFGVIAGFSGDANLPIRYSESHDVVVRVDVYEGEKLEDAYMATFNDQLSKAEDTAMDTNTDALTELWQSTAALYQRFGLQPTLEATRRVFMEEALEFITEHVHAEISGNGAQRTANEAADVLVTLLGALMLVAPLDELNSAIVRTIAKNDAKTHATHEVNSAGKIARKAVQS